MSAKNNQLNFEGKTIYVGIDVHKRQWTVSIIVEDLLMNPFSQNPYPEVLANHLKENYPNAKYKAVYEAGFCGFWVQRELEKEGIECWIVNPADVPTTNMEKKRKTDKRDSEKLARGLKNGSIKSIYIPKENQLKLRNLIRTRKLLVKDQTRLKNRIKSALKQQGFEYSGDRDNWSKKYIKWLSTFSRETNPEIYYPLKQFLDLKEQLKDIRNHILNTAKLERWKQQVDLLTSIPGISENSALIILSEIGDISRFKTLDQLCSYVGIVPNCHSSGDKERTGRMTKRGNKFLKCAIIESAWVAIRKDPVMVHKYQKLKERMNGNKAIVRIAKKLLNRIRFVLNNKQEYLLGIVK